MQPIETACPGPCASENSRALKSWHATLGVRMCWMCMPQYQWSHDATPQAHMLGSRVIECN